MKTIKPDWEKSFDALGGKSLEELTKETIKDWRERLTDIYDDIKRFGWVECEFMNNINIKKSADIQKIADKNIKEDIRVYKLLESFVSQVETSAYERGYAEGAISDMTTAPEMGTGKIIVSKTEYCRNCKYESNKRYCHMGILMNFNKKYCRYKSILAPSQLKDGQ